jgi:polyisoprenoid-binding protein YceI
MTALALVRMRFFALAALAVALSACAPPVREAGPPQAPKQPPADFPRDHYAQLAARGKPVYRIDPERSLVVIEVRRAGSLARLGHDHVVASHDVEGYVAPDEARADLYVALDSLSVDEPALRAEAGFDTQPSESDIVGTRANMHEKVLETQKFPYALIRVHAIEKRPMGARLAVALTLHGVTREMEAPAQIESAEGELRVTGRLAFAQTEFGITPYSILGGAIQVRDRVELRFKIASRPGL